MWRKADKIKEQIANQELFYVDTSKQEEAIEAEDAMEAADHKAGLQTAQMAMAKLNAGLLTTEETAANIRANLNADITKITTQELTLQTELPKEATPPSILPFYTPQRSVMDQAIIDQRIEQRMQWSLLHCDTQVILFGTYSDLLRFVDSIANYTMEDPHGFHSFPMETDGSPYFSNKMVSSVEIRVPRGAIEWLHKRNDFAVAWYAQAVDFQGNPHGIVTGNTEVMPIDPDSVRKALLAVGW